MDNYKTIMVAQIIPGKPIVAIDRFKKSLVHVYQNTQLETSNFQSEISYYLKRKQTFSGNVLTVSRIKDQHISYSLENAGMEVSVVTDYVPWRLQLFSGQLTLQQAFFILDGSCRGFRQLLHRVRSPFLIQNYMIGIDGNGQVKVWWNELYSKSNFGFVLTTNVRLRDMVKSLLNVLTQKMNPTSAGELQRLFQDVNLSFVTLEQRIKQNSKGLDLQVMGRKLINRMQEYKIITQECKQISTPRTSSIIVDPNVSTTSRLMQSPTERKFITPTKKEEESSRMLITKRTYKDGASPKADQKLKIIKDDIENLRNVVQKTPQSLNPGMKLRSSKSVDLLYSYNKGLNGNEAIPEVKQAIRQSQVNPTDLTVSRFVEVKPQSQQLINPQQCTVCDSLQMLKRSQLSSAHQPLFLSKLQNFIGQQKQIISTSRSMSESRLQKSLGGSILKNKFGQSEKKMTEKVYFTSLMDI